MIGSIIGGFIGAYLANICFEEVNKFEPTKKESTKKSTKKKSAVKEEK
jgi:hypothetical protein